MSCPTRTILSAGVAYFGIVFSAGFIFGTIRQLWIVPWLGVMRAELLEMPFMLAVVVLAARFAVIRFRLPPRSTARLGAGAIALGLLLMAELTLVLGLRGITLAEYIGTREPISGTVYLIMLGIFALMPWLLGLQYTQE
jgi:hypothetical protein